MHGTSSWTRISHGVWCKSSSLRKLESVSLVRELASHNSYNSTSTVSSSSSLSSVWYDSPSLRELESHINGTLVNELASHNNGHSTWYNSSSLRELESHNNGTLVCELASQNSGHSTSQASSSVDAEASVPILQVVSSSSSPSSGWYNLSSLHELESHNSGIMVRELASHNSGHSIVQASLSVDAEASEPKVNAEAPKGDYGSCNNTLQAFSSVPTRTLKSNNVSEPKSGKRSMTCYEAQRFNTMRNSSIDEHLLMERSRKVLIHRIIHNISYKCVGSEGGRGGGRRRGGGDGRCGRGDKTLQKDQ